MFQEAGHFIPLFVNGTVTVFSLISFVEYLQLYYAILVSPEHDTKTVAFIDSASWLSSSAVSVTVQSL